MSRQLVTTYTGLAANNPLRWEKRFPLQTRRAIKWANKSDLRIFERVIENKSRIRADYEQTTR